MIDEAALVTSMMLARNFNLTIGNGGFMRITE